MISIVIPTFNKSNYTIRCLYSLLNTTGIEYELIIVDNGSTDDTNSLLLKFQKDSLDKGIKTTLVLNQENIGASSARNQGIMLAKGSEAAFLDNDIVLRSRNWLEVLHKTLYLDEKTALVTPKLLFPFSPFAIEHTEIGITKSGSIGYIGRGAEKNDSRFNFRRQIQCSASACVVVKRSILDEVGYFDEIFNPVQFEDNDLFYRMKSKGYHLIYEPSVEMYHFENVTTDGSGGKINFKYQTIKNGMEFKRRWHHMYEEEDGPEPEEIKWNDLPRKRLDEITDNLEMI